MDNMVSYFLGFEKNGNYRTGYYLPSLAPAGAIPYEQWKKGRKNMVSPSDKTAQMMKNSVPCKYVESTGLPKHGTAEKDLQVWFIKELKSKGFTASYNNPFNDVGIPDLKISKNGVTWFIELKKDGNTPEKHQYSYMRGLRTMGAKVTWLAGANEMEQWISNPTTKRF